MTVQREVQRFALPGWVPAAGLLISLVLAWVNFLGTAKWAAIEGSLHDGRRWWYVAALAAATVLTIVAHRRVGKRIDPGSVAPWVFLLAGAGVVVSCLLVRLPLTLWPQIPFEDDWTPLYQAAVNGVRVLERGAVMSWNWSFLGGYPTSTDVAQSFAAHAFLPMTLFGDRVGFHVMHATWFLSVPVYVWWDLRKEDRRTALVAAAVACLTTASLSTGLGKSGDVNSLAGVFSAGLAMVGSRAARLGRWWGGPMLVLGLTLALYSHIAFFGYAGLFLVLEAAYFRDRRAIVRLTVAAAVAVVAALPVHWETLRYPSYVSLNNVVYSPGAPVDWPAFLRRIYYNVEMLAFPHRWFNHYPSLVNVWSPAILAVALTAGRTRVGFYAWATLLAHGVLRFNAGELGAGLDRIMHMLPMLSAPAMAGVILGAGSRALAGALAVLTALYCAVSFTPVPHVESVRSFNPPLIDRLAGLDGNLVLVEVSPHRDMDSDPGRRTPKAPWNVHLEGLLPTVAGQRFYSQMWDGWTWSTQWRGQVVGAGSFRGRAIGETAPDEFESEMRRWGVRHLLVWTDVSRNYLAGAGHFAERWRDGRWSHFELIDADVRSAVSDHGAARLANLDPLGADVELTDVSAGDEVVLRTNFYPAWTASVAAQPIPLHSHAGQLAFKAPSSGSYVVRLEYPRRHAVSIIAVSALLLGMVALAYPLRRAPAVPA